MCGCVAVWRHGALFGLFGRAIFVKPSRQRRTEPSATRKKICEPIIFPSVKSAPFYSVSRQGWVVSNFGAFGNLFFRPSPPGGGGATHHQKSLYRSLPGGGPPHPRGPKKRAIRAIFYKEKPESVAKNFRRVRSPPPPWGPTVALYNHRGGKIGGK